MQADTFTKNVMTIHNGTLTIPADVQKELGLCDGSRVMLIADDSGIRIVNPLMQAMRKFQEGMKGAAEEAGWTSDDDVVEMIMEMRRGRK